MSGDCGHGWGYHYDGPSGPCYKCKEKQTEERIANLEHQLAEKQAEIESMQPALLRYGYLPCDECNRWFTIAMLPNHSCERE